MTDCLTIVGVPETVANLDVRVVSKTQLSVSWSRLDVVSNYTLSVSNYSGDIAATQIIAADSFSGSVQVVSGLGIGSSD